MSHLCSCGQCHICGTVGSASSVELLTVPYVATVVFLSVQMFSGCTNYLSVILFESLLSF